MCSLSGRAAGLTPREVSDIPRVKTHTHYLCARNETSCLKHTGFRQIKEFNSGFLTLGLAGRGIFVEKLRL